MERRHDQGSGRRAHGEPLVNDVVIREIQAFVYVSFETIRVIQGLRGLNVIGADVVEIMPSRDGPAQMPAQKAMRIMFEEICLIADHLVGAGGS